MGFERSVVLADDDPAKVTQQVNQELDKIQRHLNLAILTDSQTLVTKAEVLAGERRWNTGETVYFRIVDAVNDYSPADSGEGLYMLLDSATGTWLKFNTTTVTT